MFHEDMAGVKFNSAFWSQNSITLNIAFQGMGPLQEIRQKQALTPVGQTLNHVTMCLGPGAQGGR